MKILATILSLLISSSLLAQPSPAGGDPQELLDEARRLQSTLEAVQAEALNDESLAGKADALVRDVEARMGELEPKTPARLNELEQLRKAASAAATAEDRAAYDEAIRKARQLQLELDATRSRVLQEEAFMLRTVALQREVVDTMTVIEPKVPEMLRRLGDISRALGAG